MKIKTKLHLIIVFTIVVFTGIIYTNLFWHGKSDILNEQHELVEELNFRIFQEAQAGDEYFIYTDGRSKEQWGIHHRKIGEILDKMSVKFTGTDEKSFINNMSRYQKKSGSLFDQLTKYDEKHTSHYVRAREPRERIINQILSSAHSQYLEGLNLTNLVNKKAKYQHDRSNLFSAVAFGVLALFIVSFAVKIMRSITYPLSRLQQGTARVAKGDLDYRTNIRTPDEIGRLSNAFDIMVENLKAITVSRNELAREIEKREKTEVFLQESEEEYRTMIDHSSDLIWVLDKEGNFSFFNRKAEDISGHRLEDWLGKSFAPLVPPSDVPRVEKIFQEAMSGRHQQYEVDVMRKDGSFFTLSINTAPIVKSGEVVGTVSFGRDITERKKAEKALHESEARYRSYIEVTGQIA